MSEAATESVTETFITAEELLSAASKAQPHVDVNLGGVLMRLRLAPSYDDQLELERKRRDFVATIRGAACPMELRKYRELSDDALGAAALLGYSAMNPPLTLDQACALMSDGLTARVLIKGVQEGAAMHLMGVIEDRIKAGKAESSGIPSTD